MANLIFPPEVPMCGETIRVITQEKSYCTEAVVQRRNMTCGSCYVYIFYQPHMIFSHLVYDIKKKVWQAIVGEHNSIPAEVIIVG